MKKIEELSFARASAMLAVVMIHVSSTYIFCQGRQLHGMNPAYLLNQMSRFAVPLFVLISGTSLTLSAASDGPLRFYRKRAGKIGVPYLFWFLIYDFCGHGLTLAGLRDAPRFLRALLLGQGTPHLYFIPLIFQLYLLYPLLKKWVEAKPWASLIAAAAVTCVVQKFFLFAKFGFDYIPSVIRPYLWLLFPTWVFYFVLGMTLTRERLSALRNFAASNAAALLAGTLIFAFLYAEESHAINFLDALKPSMMIYTMLALVSAFSLWSLIGAGKLVLTATDFFARHSMTIYFEHVLVLRFLRRFGIFQAGTAGMLLLYVLVVAFSALLAVLLDRAAALLGRKKRAVGQHALAK
jgi:surface polysaccharide O-acyltransferase-like enzyme